MSTLITLLALWTAFGLGAMAGAFVAWRVKSLDALRWVFAEYLPTHLRELADDLEASEIYDAEEERALH